MSASAIQSLPELHHDIPDTGLTAVPSIDPNGTGSITSKSNILGSNLEDGMLTYHTRKSDILLLLGIFFMLCWPWVFFGVLFARGGIALSGRFAMAVRNNPSNTNFFITTIAVIANMIVTSLFSRSVLRYSQGWMAPKKNVSYFQLSLISAFRGRHLPWGLNDRKYLLARKRWKRVALVLACIVAFTFVTSGFTTILTPLPIPRRESLSGTELNFSSTAPACLEWLNTQAKSMTNTCQWKKYKDLNYNTCRDTQMTDILESGRLNVLSLPPSDFVVVTFSGLGAKGGLQTLNPLRGALPIGPNGVQAFNTLNSSLLQNLSASVQNISNPNSFFPSYIYMLGQQGITSNISCSSDSQSPVRVYPSDQDPVGTVQFNGTCDGQADVLPSGTTFTSLNSNNSLTFWACKSRPDPGDASSYLFYLRGLQNYAESIGNITCTATIQPAIFPVTYDSSFGVFYSGNASSTSPTTFPGFIDQAVGALGSLIADAQTQEINLVAESVTALGLGGFPGVDQQADYLLLYQAMIQGILEYEVAYTRLLYSTFSNRPPSCDRIVGGLATYTVQGWRADFKNIGYLMPMTTINLASLFLLLVAMWKRKKGSFKDDPTDPEVLASAKPERHVAGKHGKMGGRVVFQEKVYAPADV